MPAKIMLNPDEVWGYFEENKKTLAIDPIIIAENNEGVRVSLYESDGLPTFLVTLDCEEIEEQFGFNEEDCEATVKMLYKDYIEDRCEDYEGEDDNGGELEQSIREEEIELREEELELAVKNMLLEFEPGIEEEFSFDGCAAVDEMTERLKNIVCEFLIREYGISVYRPTYLEDDSGGYEFVEYPYGETNPLY